MNNLSNSSQALEWLSQGKNISLKGNEFICCERKNKFLAVFYKKHERKELQKVTNFIQTNLKSAQENNRECLFNLSNAIITKYANNKNVEKIIALFERKIVKQGNNKNFSHPSNQASFNKWKKYEMPEELYKKHPEFCSFLESSGLLSQIKITRDSNNELRPKEIDGEAAIFVNGEWMKWPQLNETFEAVYSSTYQETFIVKKNTREVYTYLDNGKGLQPHHPFLTEFTPVSVLNEDDYQKVLKKAHCFIRPQEAHLSESDRNKMNEDRTFIIQVVTTFDKGPNTKSAKLRNTTHAFVRLIVGKDNPQLNIKKGEVYEVGYFRQSSKSLKAPLLKADQGRFRSPDSYEYKTGSGKVITSIPVAKEEARAFYLYTQRYFRDGVNLGKFTGFHFVHQNCSTYVRAALQAAGIAVPTQISFNNLFYAFIPNWIRSIGQKLATAKNATTKQLDRTIGFLPSGFRNRLRSAVSKVVHFVSKFFEGVTAFSVGVPLKAALGGLTGEGGVAFKTPESEPQIQPELSNWKRWFNLSNYKINMPGVLRDWQQEQPSTFVSENPIKMAIVPQMD